MANGSAAEAVPAAQDAAPPVPGEKLKRLPKPDDEEYNAKFDKLNAQIMAMNTRLGEVKEMLDAFHDKRKSGSSEQVELRNKINDEKARFQAVLVSPALSLHRKLFGYIPHYLIERLHHRGQDPSCCAVQSPPRSSLSLCVASISNRLCPDWWRYWWPCV